MNKSNYNNYDLDFLIKKAAISLAEKDSALYDMLEKDESIINPNQDELDEKIYAMINNHLGKDSARIASKKRFKSIMFKAAAFVLILLSGFIIPFVTVDAFRERVLNFYIENFDTHATFTPKEEIDQPDEFTVGYVPEGYLESDEFKTPLFYSISYYNQTKNIIDITFYNDESAFNIDTEGCEQFNLFIKNKNAYIYRKSGFVSLVFKFYEGLIAISSNDDTLSNEDLIEISESIK